MDESINSFSEAFSAVKIPVAIYSVVGIILLIILFIICKKSGKKYKELSKKEMTYYIDNAFNWVQPKASPSGNVNYTGNGVTYSRGNRRVEFKFLIEKNTLIAPCVVDDWFLGRNYNKREEDDILQDIKNYLEENRYVKTVTIVSDEEYTDAMSIYKDNNENNEDNYNE